MAEARLSRTTLFTALLGNRIIRARAAGATIADCARKAEIGESTLYLWLTYGDQGIDPYVVFAQRFRAAKLAADRAFIDEQIRLLETA